MKTKKELEIPRTLLCGLFGFALVPFVRVVTCSVLTQLRLVVFGLFPTNDTNLADGFFFSNWALLLPFGVVATFFVAQFGPVRLSGLSTLCANGSYDPRLVTLECSTDHFHIGFQ
jgi:hypothetical protein